jgi:propionyl-CoA carboxylase alpha chain
VVEGAEVTQGQPLVWLEAMKMEHRIVSPASGTLTALHAVPGRQVEVGALLAVVTETATESVARPIAQAAPETVHEAANAQEDTAS